ncbi:alternate-type signal peptide domain-containing protein [Leucobacter viscericola]|uniref:Alternate-type signal peptide domain-containing protein n=1 Tax=Leucobacter viscericola TaxID=2714935 RepID=A0A6G7XFV1_9MICO|nr:alternate-type signal peptide domain-containing protein [Leucobacter viscericola]QIK63346.1 alternate-type signal peptide domain-containing protein [Leucobacter viscericola]
MNKLTKSSIAAAAGIALLMGGAGTLAFWNDTIDAGTTGTISAGTLSLSNATAGSWTDQNGKAVDVAAFRAVPGDTLTYKTKVDVAAIGDNLTGTIGIGSASIAPATAGTADTQLAALLTDSATFTVNGAAGSTFTATGTAQAIDVTVTVEWPSGTPAADNLAKLGSVSLADFAITATQA